MNSDSRAMLTASALAAVVMLSVRGCDIPTPPVPPVIIDPPVIVDPPVVSAYRVLIIEETGQRSLLKPAQLAILTSAPFRAWLAQQGAALRVWDRDIDAVREDAQWRAMLAKQGATPPWLIVNGKGEFSGPLPGTVEETQAIVGRYRP